VPIDAHARRRPRRLVTPAVDRQLDRPAPSVIRPKPHNGLGEFRFVGRQAGEIRVPVRNVDDSRRLLPRGKRFGRRLDDVQSIIIEKECVISEQVAQLRNERMIVRDDLSRKLIQRLRNLCRRQLLREQPLPHTVPGGLIKPAGSIVLVGSAPCDSSTQRTNLSVQSWLAKIGGRVVFQLQHDT
jgi:hypothetical protein